MIYRFCAVFKWNCSRSTVLEKELYEIIPLTTYCMRGFMSASMKNLGLKLI